MKHFGSPAQTSAINFSRSGMQKDLENTASVEQMADLIEFLLLPQ